MAFVAFLVTPLAKRCRDRARVRELARRWPWSLAPWEKSEFRALVSEWMSAPTVSRS